MTPTKVYRYDDCPPAEWAEFIEKNTAFYKK